MYLNLLLFFLFVCCLLHWSWYSNEHKYNWQILNKIGHFNYIKLFLCILFGIEWITCIYNFVYLSTHLDALFVCFLHRTLHRALWDFLLSERCSLWFNRSNYFVFALDNIHISLGFTTTHYCLPVSNFKSNRKKIAVDPVLLWNNRQFRRICAHLSRFPRCSKRSEAMHCARVLSIQMLTLSLLLLGNGLRGLHLCCLQFKWRDELEWRTRSER